MTDLGDLAARVDDAARTATAIEQLSLGADFDLAQSYDIQKQSIDLRLARGETMTGVKMGFTSRAKMAQMGVEVMIWGRLTDKMRIEDSGEIDLADYVHPRVEPEIAYLLGAPLTGNVSPAEALEAVAAIAPAMEIIDSRYADFKFSLEDVVADNCSSSSFVLGPWNDKDADISNLGMILEFDGAPVQIGSSAAILGHPARALVAAARMCAAGGVELQAGWIVMAGAATEAQAMRPGIAVRAEVERLGTVSFSVVG